MGQLPAERQLAPGSGASWLVRGIVACRTEVRKFGLAVSSLVYHLAGLLNSLDLKAPHASDLSVAVS